jgi:hypothetical protein
MCVIKRKIYDLSNLFQQTNLFLLDGIALGIMLIYLSKYQCIYDVPEKYNSDEYTKTQNMKPEPSQKKTINLISRLICEH